jgi:hypothetical protein
MDTEAQRRSPFEAAWRRGNACAGRGEYAQALVEYAVAWGLLPYRKTETAAAAWVLFGLGDMQLLTGDAAGAFETLCLAVGCPGGEQVPFLNWRVIETLHAAHGSDWPSYHSDARYHQALRSPAVCSWARLFRWRGPQEAVDRRRVYLECCQNFETWSRPEAAWSPQALKPFVRPPWVEYPGLVPWGFRQGFEEEFMYRLFRPLFWDRLTPEERAEWLQEWPAPDEDWSFFLEGWVRPSSSETSRSSP